VNSQSGLNWLMDDHHQKIQKKKKKKTLVVTPDSWSVIYKFVCRFLKIKNKIKLFLN
jgi:glycerol kinase